MRAVFFLLTKDCVNENALSFIESCDVSKEAQ